MRSNVATRMRITTITLSCGLVIVAVISLVVRDVFFVRALSLLVLAGLSVIGFLCSQRSDHRQVARATISGGMLVLAGLAFTNTPLRLTFAVFESRFESIGDQLVRGEHPDFPTWIGPFRVIDGGVRDGSGAPYLMTSGHSDEINGFVRDPQGSYFNLWSITPVSEDWAYIEED